jgi:histidinol dehydrogenase
MIEILQLTNDNKSKILDMLRKRKEANTTEIEQRVKAIINAVRDQGDKSLKSFTKEFDKVDLDSIEVSAQEIEEGFNSVDKDFVEILEESKKNIEGYHKNQIQKGYIYTKDLGVYMGQRVIPLDKVGVYVPGGTAAYPSSVLMNVVPAKIAGVNEVVMVTPPNKDGSINSNILAAAKVAGVDRIFKVGGAQAVAALAYGTESVPKVNKIVGPGNAYVAEAKRAVYGEVGIDMVAGPSEISIIADENANARFIAADLMSQAEHDVLASSILLTTSKSLSQEVIKELQLQVEELSRKEIIKLSLEKYGKIIICKDIDECIEMVNLISPEHLEILIKNPMEVLGQIKNAASIFLGEYTPEPVGDYFGGTNHVLPTNGNASFSSPLSVDDFIKKSSFLYYSKEALLKDGDKIIKFTDKEGLTAHGNSVKVRIS